MKPEAKAGSSSRLPLADATSDRWLVDRCLGGDEEAWTRLVYKYKNLVYSIAIRRGLSPDDASDLFQAVWLQVHSRLSMLRKKGSIRSWLISITLNESYHWLQRNIRRDRHETGAEISERDGRFSVDPTDPAANETTLQVQQAIGELTPRCQELIRLLFYEYPKVPYKKIAPQLGLAVGSIGFIRGRCLEKLHQLLEERGVR